MGQIFKIREVERDEKLGIVKKKISSHQGNFSFESPVVSQRTPKQLGDIQKLMVNEVVRQIDYETVSELDLRGIKPFAHKVRLQFLLGKFNATIFNFKFDSVPEETTIRLLAQTLHSSSESTIILPAVKTAFLQEDKKYSIKKIVDYVRMMQLIIQDIEKIGNRKEFIGTIPLIPPKFVRQIIELYLSEGLKAFVIDANYKDIMLNEGDFRIILSEINKEIPLNETVIFACNLGIPRSQRYEIRSDDFLSIFAYVDILGCNFKPRGGGIPRAKVFSRNSYAYNISTYPEVSRELGRQMNYVSLGEYNKSEQLKETLKVRNLLGIEKMKNYLQTKEAVDPASMRHLESIASKVKIA